jgi:hypothetical protein
LQSDGYWIYRLLDRPVLAAPAASRRLRRAAWNHYPAETPNRRRIKRAIQLAQAAGLDRLLAHRAEKLPLPGEFDFSSWLDRARRDLGRRDLHAVVVWPPPARSRARVYVHLLGENARRVAFAKLTFDAYNNDRIARESRALASLDNSKPAEFRVPRVLGGDAFQNGRYLLLEPLPQDAVSLNVSWPFVKERIIAQYAGTPRTLTRDQLQQLPWWAQFRRESVQSIEFLRELDRLPFSEIQVCRAHGDLGGHNMVQSGQEVWLFDWEEACDNAPIRADEVRFYLGQHQRQILDDPSCALSGLGDAFSLRTASHRLEVMLALAFLQSAGIGAAEIMIRHWAML